MTDPTPSLLWLDPGLWITCAGNPPDPGGVGVVCPCLGLQVFLAGLPTCHSGAVAPLAAGCRVTVSAVVTKRRPCQPTKAPLLWPSMQPPGSVKPQPSLAFAQACPASSHPPLFSLGPWPRSPLCSGLPGSARCPAWMLSPAALRCITLTHAFPEDLAYGKKQNMRG